MGEANASIEEDVLLSSPMEIETQQDTAISDSGNKVSTLNRRIHGIIAVLKQ